MARERSFTKANYNIGPARCINHAQQAGPCFSRRDGGAMGDLSRPPVALLPAARYCLDYHRDTIGARRPSWPARLLRNCRFSSDHGGPRLDDQDPVCVFVWLISTSDTVEARKAAK